MNMTRLLASLLSIARHIACLWLVATGAAFAQGYAITTTHLSSDAFGNVILSTDELGNVLWRERYQPYGDKRINQATGANPVNLPNPQDRVSNGLGFHGKEADAATGLSYFGARYYDPLAGRFMGVDSQRFDPANPHTFNRYAYGNGNPYKYKDPDGKMAVEIFAAATVLGVGAVITYYSKSPAEQKQMISDLQRLRDLIFNQSSEDKSKGETVSGSGKEPPVPGATPGRPTKGRTTQWEKGGGIDEANNDFDRKGPRDVTPLPDSDGGRRGVLPDGRKINVRPDSGDGRPTLEIQDGKNRDKVRYDP